ncbi:MAG: metallophosphoesterase family protein [Myxococcota bacterium]
MILRMTLSLLAILILPTACGGDSGSDTKADAAVIAPDADATPDAAGSTDAALAPDGAAADDMRAVTEPASWVTEPNRTVRNMHMTWQRDPATTMTLQWATNDIDLTTYVPRVWAVPTAMVTGTAEAPIMPWASRFVTEGEGKIYREALAGFETGEIDFVIWTVELTGLVPDTEYTYRVGTWEEFDAKTGEFKSPDLTDARTFKTGITKGERKPFEMVMAGDSRGGMEEIRANIHHINDNDARLWVFNGDMTNGGAQVEWDDWQDAMSPVLTSRVLMPVHGNHEIFANIFYEQYALPQEPGLPEDLVEHAWSLDFANVHLVGLDSNVEARIKDQIDWLDADLAAARKDPDIDWIFVMMHHGVYSASNHGSTMTVQEHWVPIFERHNVDLVFSGHDHNYERTHPLRGDKVVEPKDGIVYVVAGGFFSPGYGNGNEWWTATSTHGDVRNYVRVGVAEKTVKVTAYSGDSTQVIDTFELKH